MSNINTIVDEMPLAQKLIVPNSTWEERARQKFEYGATNISIPKAIGYESIAFSNFAIMMYGCAKLSMYIYDKFPLDKILLN